MTRLRPRNVRTRLTLWYVGVLSGVLALYAGSTLTVLYVSLRQGLDRTLGAEYERIEDVLAETPDGTIRMGGHDEGEGLVEVWSPEGTLLFRSPEPDGETLGGPPTGTEGSAFASMVARSGTPLRVLTHAHHLGEREVVIRVAVSEEPVRHEWRELAAGLLAGLPVAVAIAGRGGHWLARRALAPIDRMARHAERLTADTLGERLPVENPEDELGHLARVFNVSLGRIEESFARLRRFTADVSHELRTPLTAIRSVGEVSLGAHRTDNEYRETIGSLLEEADRLTVMVDTLLSLSRADAGEVRLDLEPVDLVGLAHEVAAHLAVLAEERNQRLLVEPAADPVVVKADRLVLRQALVNIVDNAIKYSPRGGAVRIVVRGDATHARIDVIDQGPGIAPEHRQKIFERFYRIDPARSREEGGAGLGLSLAQWAVRAHGGRIEVEDANGRGTAFRLSLPREGRPSNHPPP